MSIAEKIARSLGRETPDAGLVDAEAAALLDGLGALRPGYAEAPLDRFLAKLTSERLTGTAERLPSLATLAARVRAYLRAHDLPAKLTIADDPALRALDWGDITITDEIAIDTPVAISRAVMAIAETGSVVVRSTSDTPTLHSFLPLHHLVIVSEQSIRPWLEDVWQEIDPRQHRCVNIITGTSGTADIEGRNVRGAHGPRFLHVFLIAG